MRAFFDSRRQWLVAAALATLGASAGAQTASVGQAAPAFELVDTQGKVVRLSDFKGKHVVLEWTNPGCPFVVKHYGSQNMQGLQKEAAAKNVVWLSISSTAPGYADYLTPPALAAQYKDWGAASAAMLMDDSGKVGHAYGARTTPHMYVIDPQGQLIYAGAIDSIRSTDPADIKTATNYVKVALADAKAGKPVSPASTQAYGCTIKY